MTRPILGPNNEALGSQACDLPNNLVSDHMGNSYVTYHSSHIVDRLGRSDHSEGDHSTSKP